MSQSRVMSLVEVVTGSVIAFVVAIWANYAVLPLFGFQVKLDQSIAITLIFTIISIARSYLIRRFFAVYVHRFAAWCQDVSDRIGVSLYRYWLRLGRLPWQPPRRTADDWPTYYTTPADWTKCKNYQTDGPTPCWHPHCDCQR
jgi:hypothetical protein